MLSMREPARPETAQVEAAPLVLDANEEPSVQSILSKRSRKVSNLTPSASTSLERVLELFREENDESEESYNCGAANPDKKKIGAKATLVRGSKA